MEFWERRLHAAETISSVYESDAVSSTFPCMAAGVFKWLEWQSA